MSQISAFDASIPVLTEVFQEKGEQPPATAPAAPADEPEASPPPAEQTGAVPEARASDSSTEPQWSALESRLSERILQQLHGQIDSLLEQRLRDSIEAALQQAIAGLTDEIRQGLHRSVETIVLGAVAQELAQLRTPKQ